RAYRTSVAATAAEMASRAAVFRMVRFDGGEHRHARLNQIYSQLRRALLQQMFAAIQPHRRQVISVGLPPQVVAIAAHADPLLGPVVILLALFVVERPVDVEAVKGGGFEIEVGQSPRQSPPMQGLSAHNARADPEERLARIGRVSGLSVLYQHG